MSGESLFCLAMVALVMAWALLDNLIDAWRERGRRG